MITDEVKEGGPRLSLDELPAKKGNLFCPFCGVCVIGWVGGVCGGARGMQPFTIKKEVFDATSWIVIPWHWDTVWPIRDQHLMGFLFLVWWMLGLQRGGEGNSNIKRKTLRNMQRGRKREGGEKCVCTFDHNYYTIRRRQQKEGKTGEKHQKGAARRRPARRAS